MIKASTNKGNPIGRWFASRLEHRIDRFWLGTALAVVGLAWLLFGMQYIALFLIGYFYTFLFFVRKKIVANYPPNGDSIIRFACSNEHPLPQAKIGFEIKPDYLLPMFGLMLFYASPAVTHALNLSPQMFSAMITNAGVGWIFLFKHKELFSAYTGDTKLTSHVAKIICIYVRYVGSAVSFATIALLWCFILFMFMRGWFDPEFMATGSSGDRYAIFAPIVANFVLFHISVSTLLSNED